MTRSRRCAATPKTSCPELVAAMALAAKGDAVAARATYVAAVASIEWDASTLGRHDHLVAVILRREAEAALHVEPTTQR